MKLSLARRARAARITAAALLGTAVVVLLPEPALAATVTFERTSEWSTGYVAKASVRNDTASTVHGWRVEFDLPAGTSVTSHWSAVLTRSGDRHIFTGQHWNATLPPGAVADFGFVTAGRGAPLNCTVNGVACSGPPPTTPPPTTPITVDGEPPTVPRNVRWTYGSINAIWWDPSTDNRGVVAYEVYQRNTLVATVTTTRYDMPVAPPPMATIFGIAAVDAAGNRSALATVTFGQLPDVSAPTAPTGLTLSLPSQGYITARWTASTDDVMVVGYEVEVNGTLSRTVGGTTALIPSGSHGVFFVAVRAVDRAGKYSPYTRAQLIIEPMPSSRSTPGTPL